MDENRGKNLATGSLVCGILSLVLIQNIFYVIFPKKSRLFLQYYVLPENLAPFELSALFHLMTYHCMITD